MPVTLYKRQKQILDFISQYIQKHGYSPTLKEIAEAMGLSSLATVHEHIAVLVRKGLLKKYEGSVRGLEVVGQEVTRPAEGIELPILGYIAAGLPIQPYRDPNATFMVAPTMVSGKKRAYVLQVRGDSMVEDGILDGDYVVVEEVSEVKNGDIVVALLENGLATLKRFYKENDRVRLEPANAKMGPIYARNVKVQGKVIALIRRFAY